MQRFVAAAAVTPEQAAALRTGAYVTLAHDDVPGRPRRVTQVHVGTTGAVRVRVESAEGGFATPWLPPEALTAAPKGHQWDRRANVWRPAPAGARGVYWRPPVELERAAPDDNPPTP